MRESGFWRMLDGSEQASLRAAALPRTFADNSFLCLEGEQSTHVFILLAGWVKIKTGTRDGRVMLAALRGEGETVGEVAQVTGYRTATVQAAGTVRTLIVGAKPFEAFLDSHAGADRAYRHAMTEYQRAAHSSQRSHGLSSGHQRLAALLLDLDGADVPLSQGELASLIGASRSTATRALADWRARGFIRTEQRRTVILNPTALSRIAGR